MKLERSLERWARCSPAAIAEGSKAQIMFCIADAKKDIATLAAALGNAAPKETDPSPLSSSRGPTNDLGLFHGCLVELSNGEQHGPVEYVDGANTPWQYKKGQHTYWWKDDGKSIIGRQYDIVKVTSSEPKPEYETPIVFGLEAQGHIPVIKRLLLEARDWPYIGRAINWDGATAKAYYERYLARAALSATAAEGE